MFIQFALINTSEINVTVFCWNFSAAFGHPQVWRHVYVTYVICSHYVRNPFRLSLVFLRFHAKIELR